MVFRIVCLSALVFCILIECGVWCGDVGRVHLSYGEPEDEMMVMWSTHSNENCHVIHSKVGYIQSNSTKSKIIMLKDSASNTAKFQHRAVITGLDDSEQYQYYITCSGQRSSNYTFRALNRTIDRASHFVVYGDMGAYEGKETVTGILAEVNLSRVDAVWHVGDFAYDLHSDDGKVGDDFLTLVEPIAANVPYMTTMGNHELHCHMEHYRTRFSMPGQSWPMSRDQMWFSYDIGLVHFISYSTEVFFSDDLLYACKQFDWLKNDLEKANKNRHIRPWIIALGHRPMLCSSDNSDDCRGGGGRHLVKRGLEDLFYVQGVDVIIQAHEHFYERSWPFYSDKVIQKSYHNPPAPVHIITGAAGNKEHADVLGTLKSSSAFAASEKRKNSYGKLTVFNFTHLQFQQIMSKTNRKLDSFFIVQEHHGKFVPGADCLSPTLFDSRCVCPHIEVHFYVRNAIIVTVTTAIFVTSLFSVFLLYRKRKGRHLFCCDRKSGQLDKKYPYSHLTKSNSEYEDEDDDNYV